MKTKLNPKLLELIEEVFGDVDDQKSALTYAACIELDTLDVLYKWGIFKDVGDEHKFRVALLERDIGGDSLQPKYKLKYPLFVDTTEDNDLYDEFYSWLVKNPKLSAHKGRFSNTQEGKKAFEDLVTKDFDISRFKASVEKYYIREGQYAKALPKFLMENAKGEYEGYKEVKSKLI